MFVLLELEADGEAVGDEGFGALAAGDWGVVGGYGFEGFVLLFGGERVDPREEDFAHFAKAVEFLELRLGPVVIFAGVDDAFEFIGGAKARDIAFEIFFVFAAAGAFEFDDAMHAAVDGGDVMRPAGCE